MNQYGHTSVECVPGARAEVGEGAAWCAGSQRLLWVDVWLRRLPTKKRHGR